MQYLNNESIAKYISLSVILSIVDTAIPKPFPWLKLGFSNIVTVYLLHKKYYREIFITIIIRVLLAQVIMGNLISIATLLSFFGNISSALVMVGLDIILPKEHFSLYPISVLGSIANISIQFLSIKLILNLDNISMLLFPSLIFSFFFGLLIALLTTKFYNYLERLEGVR